MSALQLYNRGTSAFLAAQAAFFLTAPSMVVWMLSPDPKQVTTLEELLARSFSIALLLLSFLNLLFSGEVAALYGDGGNASSPDMESPYAKPTLYATLLYHITSTILLYTYSYSNQLSSSWLSLGSVTHFLLAASGLLLILFGQGPGHISRRTGADKRTSGFPFKNREAAKRKL